MNTKQTLDAQYADIYHAAQTPDLYRSEALLPVEANTLLRHQPRFADRDVLDIGIGTGRTTAYLAPVARHYVGIDYSPAMLERARRRFPGASLRLGDMRDLSDFDDQRFDFVFASNNVLDAIDHDDHEQALIEWARVLRPGGMLAFTSHNRAHRHAGEGPRAAFSRNPITQIRLLQTLARSWANHRRIGALRHSEEGYALINDTGHEFALLHYYVDRPHQREQLSRAGFELLEVRDHAGQVLADHDAGVDSPWLMYAALRRTPGPLKG